MKGSEITTVMIGSGFWPLLAEHRAFHCKLCGSCVQRMDHHCLGSQDPCSLSVKVALVDSIVVSFRARYFAFPHPFINCKVYLPIPKSIDEHQCIMHSNIVVL